MYAFGVLLWEMLSGERAWYKQTPAQVVLQVAFQNNSLQLPLIPLPELSRHEIATCPSAGRCLLTRA